MALNLVCVLDFAGFSKGSQVSDAASAAAYWSTRPWNFVQIQDTAVAPTWQPRTGPMSDNLSFNANNGDGNSLLIGSNLNNADYIYRSLNRGATWQALTNFGARKWLAGAQSTDGLTIAGLVNDANVFVSTDGGANVSTVAVSGASQLSQIAVSGNGAKILVGDNSQGKFWLSTNSGASFALVFTAPASVSAHVAISRDGTTMLINYNTGSVSAVLLSTNNFGSSVDINPGGSVVGNTMLMNANGRVIYLATSGGSFKRTVNQGADWVSLSAPHQMGLYGGVSDDGGTFLLTDTNNNFTYLTKDFGATLTSQGLTSTAGASIAGDKSLALIVNFSPASIYTLESP